MANDQSSAERSTAARHASLKLATLADQTRAEPEFRARHASTRSAAARNGACASGSEGLEPRKRRRLTRSE